MGFKGQQVSIKPNPPKGRDAKPRVLDSAEKPWMIPWRTRDRRAIKCCESVTVYALGAFISLFPFATAQPQEATPSPAGDAESVLEEIIVTAQKRETSTHDVPISMTVFTDQDLTALNMRNVAEIANYTPNLEWDRAFQGASNSASLFVRGVGQAATFAEHSADPAVGVYLDGVYIARSLGSVMGVLDVSQVEVLRGPQGTLSARTQPAAP